MEPKRAMVIAALLCAPAVAAAAAGAGSTGSTTLLGRSEGGRPISVVQRGDPRAARRVLVVGCIHGNECSGVSVVAWLARTRLPRGTRLALIPSLNPDGAAAGTRGDARGVDLNRNFPWHWRRQGGLFASGPRPLSERESRVAARFILGYRPTVAIWFHQHRNLVDESGGQVAVERRFATRAGLPLQRLPRYSGSAVSWENAVLPHGTAFVVELPAGTLTPQAARRFGEAVLRAAG